MGGAYLSMGVYFKYWPIGDALNRGGVLSQGFTVDNLLIGVVKQ